jgi:hypothetical protein
LDGRLVTIDSVTSYRALVAPALADSPTDIRVQARLRAEAPVAVADECVVAHGTGPHPVLERHCHEGRGIEHLGQADRDGVT